MKCGWGLVDIILSKIINLFNTHTLEDRAVGLFASSLCPTAIPEWTSGLLLALTSRDQGHTQTPQLNCSKELCLNIIILSREWS